ncbi:toprim domain-containing protein [Planctomycetes bacterium TBK1r]
MDFLSRKDELDEFKTKINLCQFLASQGYQLDRRSSSRCSAVMKHGNGDKLIIARSESRTWIYFNVHGSDSGTIIDFVQREGIKLGEVRKRLRPWLGKAEIPIAKLPSVPLDLDPSKPDTAKVLAAWMNASSVEASNRFLLQRQIPARVFCHPRVVDQIRVDDRQNVLFGHWSHDGLSGYEVKNRSRDGRSFTGFAPGGTKGLFFTTPENSDSILTFCETAIDLLSLVALRGIEGNRLMSVGGQVSPLQLDLILAAVKKMPSDSQIRLAMDNDEAGRGLADRIANHLYENGILPTRIIEDWPATPGADWNDELCNKMKQSMEPTSP